MSNMMNKFAEKLQGNDDSHQKGKNAKSSNKERDDMNMDMGMGHDQSEGNEDGPWSIWNKDERWQRNCERLEDLRKHEKIMLRFFGRN